MAWTASSPIVLLLCVMAVGHCWAAYDLDEKFSQLEEKMDLMLQAMGVRTETKNTTETPPVPEEEEEIPSIRAWISPLSLTRKSKGDNTTLITIRFKATGHGLVIWTSENEASGFKQDINDSAAIEEVSFSTSPENYDPVQVLFLYQGNSIDLAHIELTIRNGEDIDDETTEFNLPIFGIQPLEEFVYEQGQNNITVMVKIPAFGEIRDFSVYSNLLIQTLLFDEDGDIDTDSPRDDMYEVLNITDKEGARIVTIEWNTSGYSPRGYLLFSAPTVYAPPSAIIEQITLSKEVGIRERDQSGPLPHGFLSFTSQNWNDNVNGTIQIPCSSDYDCILFCIPVGEDIAGFSLVKVEDDGSETPLDTKQSYIPPFHVRQHHEITRPPKAKGTEHFECRAEDSHGKMAVQAFDLNYYKPLKILEDRSGIAVVNAQTESGPVLQMILTCVAEGVPLPNITFRIGTLSGAARYGIPPDHITPGDNDTVTALKHVTLNSSDLDPSTTVPTRDVSWASCAAKHGGDRLDFALYDFTIPDNIGK